MYEKTGLYVRCGKSLEIPMALMRDFIAGKYSYADMGRLLGKPKTTVFDALKDFRHLHKPVSVSDGLRNYQQRAANDFFSTRSAVLNNIKTLCSQIV